MFKPTPLFSMFWLGDLMDFCFAAFWETILLGIKYFF